MARYAIESDFRAFQIDVYGHFVHPAAILEIQKNIQYRSEVARYRYTIDSDFWHPITHYGRWRLFCEQILKTRGLST